MIYMEKEIYTSLDSITLNQKVNDFVLCEHM